MRTKFNLWIMIVFAGCAVGTSPLEPPAPNLGEETNDSDGENDSDGIFFNQGQWSGANVDVNLKREKILQYLNESGGERILSGQESMLWDVPWESFYPSTRDEYVSGMTGEVPAVFSSDFGDFDLSKMQGPNNQPATLDDVRNARSRVVDMAKAYSERGSIIMLSHHMCQPDIEDGCSYETMSAFSYENPYPSWKINEMLSPGSHLHTALMERLDEIAGYLKRLQDQGVVVLWRPYHENNMPWFWWGNHQRSGELFRQMHDRFENHHGLRNLIWVYSANHWFEDFQQPRLFSPGQYYVQVYGVDVYQEHGHQFEKRIHDYMLELAEWSQPIALTEIGSPPADWNRFRSEQDQWAFWTTWWNYEMDWTPTNYMETYGHPETLERVDLPNDWFNQ